MTAELLVSLMVLGAMALDPAPLALYAADQPQWGQAWSRNMISTERGLPISFDLKTGQGVKWSAKLGTETHSSPVIANGRVYIGTNNGHPRDLRCQGDRGILMCFDEQTGRLLWQLVVPKREEDIYFDWPNSGISSPVTVEGDRVYLVSNRGEVLCLDARGMANGNDGPFTNESRHMTPASEPALTPGPNDADIIWLFDLTTGAGIWSHDAAHSSIAIDGDYLYLNTGTGVDNTHKKIRTPDAPSLAVLDKRTGRLVARDQEHIAPNIFHCTWSAPAIADVNGRSLVFFNAGNGVVYAFETLEKPGSSRIGNLDSGASTPGSNTLPRQLISLSKVWQFDFDPAAPKTNVHKYNTNRQEGPSNFYGMPVFYQNRLYVAGGGDVFWGKNEAWLKCIDPTRGGDITANGLIWSYPLHKHVLSTPAIWNGLIFIADCGRVFHCLDAETGKLYWSHDIEGEAWASPLAADGKVYIGTRSGAFYIFGAEKEKKILSTIELGKPISSTCAAANGTLFVATMDRLYALVRTP